MNIGQIGLLGEIQAARYLKRQGMKILERRYRSGYEEIDLIALDGDILVFAEVKSRPQGKMGEGLMAVTSQKQTHLRRAAQGYLRQHPAREIRFDVIEISAAGLRHIRNAF